MADTLNPMDITYCEGARLLQDSQADIGSILIQRPNGGLICQHCYLVVADANDVKAIAPDQDWSLLVSCHVQACGSLHDRRAAYSCYACLERGKTAVQPSMTALREHLQACDLIKLSEQHRKRKDADRPLSVPRSSTRKSKVDFQPVKVTETPRASYPAGNAETVHSPTSSRKPPSHPFTQMQGTQPVVSNGPATPIHQTYPQTAPPPEVNPPLPSRPKTNAPTTAERMYTPPSVRRPEQPAPPNTSYPHAADMFNIPGGFPNHNLPASDSRASSLLDSSPTVPRRKEVRLEAPANPQDKSFPAQPSRAPPAPPVLSPPGPPPYYQGKGSSDGANQPSPASSYDPHLTTMTGADRGKIQQLVSLGIPRMDAEYLLNRTGGDVNAAAELQISEMGSLSGYLGEQPSPPAQPAAHPNPLASSPVDRRNRRSK